MKQKKTLPRIFVVGRNDQYQKHLKSIFLSHNMIIYDVLTPTQEFILLNADAADVIIADVEDKGFPFTDCELLEIIIELFPLKKVIAVTNNFDAEIIQKVKQLGATGYIYRNNLDEGIVECVQRIASGGSCFMTAR